MSHKNDARLQPDPKWTAWAIALTIALDIVIVLAACWPVFKR